MLVNASTNVNYWERKVLPHFILNKNSELLTINVKWCKHQARNKNIFLTP